MSKNEMKTIREMRALAEKVFLGKVKQEEITFKSEDEKGWFEYALKNLESDTYQ